jgi:acetyl esterase/lipase
MKLSQVAPELRGFYRIMRTTPVGTALGRRLLRKAIVLVPQAKPLPGVTMEKIPLASGQEIHVYTPAGVKDGGAVLWIHGGGMVIGSVAQDDAACFATASALGAVVVSVDYRLAPEHPFPAPLDDCTEAWDWIQGNAELRSIDPTRVAVGGQSAGGGLAASVVQRLVDRGGIQPVAQWLFCPMLDDRTAANRDLDSVKHFLWNNNSNRAGWASYLSVAPGSAVVPEYASPARRQTVVGFPPTWIGAGDIELFHDEAVAYGAALRAAGVDVVVDVVAGAPHAFEAVGTPLGLAYLDRARAWLKPYLSASTTTIKEK